MRRLPVYLLIDNSSSMEGEPIESANAGLAMLISSLRQNPYALDSVYLRIHTFSNEMQTILPLIPLDEVQFHNLVCSKFSESNLANALKELKIIIKNELNFGSQMSRTKADWSPLLIIISNGQISDYEEFYKILPKFKEINFADILILIVGYGKALSFLKIKELSNNIVQMDTMDNQKFNAFFRWVSQNIENNSQGIKNNTLNLEKAEFIKVNITNTKEEITKPVELIKITESKIENIKPLEDNNVILNKKFTINKILISFPYDEISEFSETRAKVKFRWKYGFIDENGKQIIPIEYDKVEKFSENLAIIYKNGYAGFIDKFNREVIPPIYKSVNSFSEGLAAVNKEGKGVFLSEGSWGFIDNNGMEIIPAIYEAAYNFSQSFARVKKENKWGFINKNGEELIPFLYDFVQDFKEGFAAVNIGGKIHSKKSFLIKGGKFGFINQNGDLVIPLKYDLVGEFSEGLAAVKLANKWGVIDNTGNEIIPISYDYIGKFSQGLAAIKIQEKWGFIDKTGNLIIPTIYDGIDINNGFKENLAAVNVGGSYGKHFAFNGGLWGFINKEGREVIKIKYNFVNSFSDKLALVNKGSYLDNYGFVSGNGKYGFINQEGSELLELDYDEANNFKENTSVVKQKDKWYLLSKEYY